MQGDSALLVDPKMLEDNYANIAVLIHRRHAVVCA